MIAGVWVFFAPPAAEEAAARETYRFPRAWGVSLDVFIGAPLRGEGIYLDAESKLLSGAAWKLIPASLAEQNQKRVLLPK